MSSKAQSSKNVQTFGKKKTSIAVALVKPGKGSIRINGQPLELVEPEPLRLKVQEPILLLGAEKFANVDMKIRVKGGGYVSQIYAIRQAISKGLIAWYQKNVDEAKKREIKATLIDYDRSLLVADPRRAEPKKFGGRGNVVFFYIVGWLLGVFSNFFLLIFRCSRKIPKIIPLNKEKRICRVVFFFYLFMACFFGD